MARPTHFLSIPLTSAQLSRSMSLFSADAPSFNVPMAAIRPPSTLHITLGVLDLSGGTAPATQALQAVRGGSPLTISLEGLHAMGSSRETSVLFAAPAGEGLLQRCEDVRGVFGERGLLMGREELKMHATVVNTVYVGGRGRRGRKMLLDARDLMAKYEGFVWADDVVVDRVCLCRMGERAVGGGDAVYEVVADTAF